MTEHDALNSLVRTFYAGTLRLQVAGQMVRFVETKGGNVEWTWLAITFELAEAQLTLQEVIALAGQDLGELWELATISVDSAF